MREYTRRRLLGATASSLALGSLAGCVGGSLTTGDPGGDSASNDARAVASFFVFGDFTRQVAGQTATAETLVPVGQHGHGWEPGPQIQGQVLDADLFVLGVEGFQPWADDVAANVREDGAATELVRIGSNVDLLDFDHGEDDHDDEAEDHHEEADEHHDEDPEGEENPAHDHGEADPHFWLDPVRAKQAVETVRDGLANADDANADAYAENAGAYESRLDDLHDSFESSLDSASKDVVLVAGHDAFGYLAERYGFEVEALTGVSPDDTPTPKDVERAQHVIEEHDLEYVVADPLESQQAATQLVEETDAEEVLPLTSIPGLTEPWDENDWGYAEIMDEVNRPTLTRALGAE